MGPPICFAPIHFSAANFPLRTSLVRLASLPHSVSESKMVSPLFIFLLPSLFFRSHCCFAINEADKNELAPFADGFGLDGPSIPADEQTSTRWCHFALLTPQSSSSFPVNGLSSNCFLPSSNRFFSNLRNLNERTRGRMNYLEASEFEFHSEQMAREGGSVEEIGDLVDRKCTM